MTLRLHLAILDVVRLLEIVGEAATRVSEELRARYPQIAWSVSSLPVLGKGKQFPRVI